MPTYCHYTTPDNALQIANSKLIKKSTGYTDQTGRRQDAIAGPGVYMTTIPPHAGKPLIAYNNYDRMNRQAAVHRIINSGIVSSFMISLYFQITTPQK